MRKDWDWLDIAFLGAVAFLLGATIAFCTSCATAPVDYTRGPLIEQILRAIPGHTGLVNTEKRHDVETGVAVANFIEYDLNAPEIRQRLRDAGFICQVGDKQYRVASKKPGLIFETYKQSCTLGMFCGPRQEIELDYIAITDYQKLVDMKVECWSIFTFKETDI